MEDRTHIKKIAILANSLANGGAERIASNLSLAIKDYDCDIIINCEKEQEYPFNGRIVSFVKRAEKDKQKLFYQIIILIKRFKYLRQKKKELEYDAVISFSDSSNIVNVLTGNKNCKVILSVHNNITKASRDWKYKFIVAPLIRLLYNRADVIVAVSEGVKEDLVNKHGLYRGKVITVLNGIDTELIDSMSCEELTDQEKEWCSGENIIVTMGRLEWQKGQWHLIKALSILEKRGVEFKLLIIGKGSQASTLRNMSEKMGIGDKVVFCGFRQNPFRIMKRADICVFSSMFEGFGNTLIEAMRCGIPCISTDYDSGAREVLAPNTDVSYKNRNKIEFAEYGILTPVCTSDFSVDSFLLDEGERLLAEAVEVLLLDKKLREEYKKRGMERSRDFDTRLNIGKWLDIL